MTQRASQLQLISTAALLLAAACSSSASPSTTFGASGATGSSGSSTGGSSASGSGGQVGAGGNTAGGTAGASAGGTAGAGTGGSAAGASGSAGTGGGDLDPQSPRPLKVDPSNSCKCEIQFKATIDPDAGKGMPDVTHANDNQSMFVDTTKKMQGKLVIALGGIGGGPGGGGIEGFAKAAGFHVFLVATQTATSSAPDQYKTTIKTMPNDPEANRQVGDGRMEAWDGKDRVSWLDIKPPDSIVNRTQHALAYAMTADPGGDWGYYLNADGSVRWTDVYMVGYSFGSQTIAMVSKYVRFGRVILTSGPQDEGFPNATWISQPSATPVDRLYMAVGFNVPYPSTDTRDGEVMGMFTTVHNAGWLGTPINVVPKATGPFMDSHQLAMVESAPYDPHAPGGHTVFCNNDPMSGWLAPCTYLFGVQ